MAEASLKILVSGDVEGRFGALFSRVNSVLKKAGSFDLLICVGEFFHGEASREEWQKYRSGELKVPLPTLILGPTKKGNWMYFEDGKGRELCDNVTYLGRQGVFTGSSGLKIAYLSGRDGSQGGEMQTCFRTDDSQALCVSAMTEPNFNGVDILLTSQWPQGVEKYALDPEGVSSAECGSAAIAQICLALRPRYHFTTGEGTFYERKPYRNHKVLAESAKHVTRFIALAKVGNPQKRKFLYAFNIVPMSKIDKAELTKQPPDVTECPFRVDESATCTAKPQEEKAPQYFYNMKQDDTRERGQKRKHGEQDGGRENKQNKKQPQATGPCWFCLASPEVEKHLVVSVGDECYLALAKGGLTPDHVLILPIGHHQSTVKAPPDVIDELERYKSALRKCFLKLGKGVIFYERNYKSQHLQIQAIPFPLSVEDEVKEVFLDSAQNHPQSFELHEIPKLTDLKQIVPAGAPYFYVELPSGEKLLHRIKKYFPLQFGREVMASQEILDMTDRVDWKNCKVSKDDEVKMAKDFRSLFKNFDFSA